MDFLLVFAITFIITVSVSLLISYCRRRLRKTPHGLTGICHQTGDRMCAACANQTRSKDDHAKK